VKTLKFWMAAIALLAFAGNAFADTLQTEVAEYAKAYSDHNWAQVKLSKVPDSDPTSARVLAIASRMARLTDKKWELCVFDRKDAPPAFELPGYRLAVSKTLADRLSDDALAWVIGHEMGHGLMRHVEQVLGSLMAEDAEIKLLTGSYTPLPTWQKLFAAYAADAHRIERQQEVDADGIGVKLATAAGFNGKAGAEQFLGALPTDAADQGHPTPAQRLALIDERKP
jgi:Zn-dependent protease with chaperone function